MAEVLPHKNGESGVTLLVRHLPEAIPIDVLTRLFSHYGAVCVRHMSQGRVKNCAFVDFNNDMLASRAHQQLHGMSFLGKVLSVERAAKLDSSHQESEGRIRKDPNSTTKEASVPKCASDSSTGFSIHASEPIAKKLSVEYPFPPHLEYAYPPPDGHILTNIVNALIAVPRFYTQVLHLMNKMSIPAPFGKALPTPALPVVPCSTSHHPQLVATKMEAQSSDESQIESSEEEIERDCGRATKRMKRQVIVGPAVDKDVDHESVGLKSVSLMSKEKPIIKKKNPVLQIRIASKQSQPEQKDDVSVRENVEEFTETSDQKTFASIQELNSGKLPPEEILSLPRFKNYTPGEPSRVLYIKNLAKDVAFDDFFFIFGSFFGSIDSAKSNLSVKLMQEGRMRDQAFVTFPTTDLARNALNAVNGYVFKGKPMVIQFGRNPAPPSKLTLIG